MFTNKLKKIINLIDKIKNESNQLTISDFLDWFYDKLDLHFNRQIKWFDLQKWDIFYVNLWKNIWSELNKIRPCIVYSKKFANKWDTVVIIPLRSYKWKINKDLFIFLESDNENNLELNSIIDISWIRQISKKRIKGYIWKLSNEKMLKIDNKVDKIFWIKNRE